MKKSLVFYLIIIVLVTLQTLLVFFLNEPVEYTLKIMNANNYSNKHLLAPKSIDFRPINVNQLRDKYKNTIYNFYYYVDPYYLEINGHEVCLKLLEDLVS